MIRAPPRRRFVHFRQISALALSRNHGRVAGTICLSGRGTPRKSKSAGGDWNGRKPCLRTEKSAAGGRGVLSVPLAVRRRVFRPTGFFQKSGPAHSSTSRDKREGFGGFHCGADTPIFPATAKGGFLGFRNGKAGAIIQTLFSTIFHPLRKSPHIVYKKSKPLVQPLPGMCPPRRHSGIFISRKRKENIRNLRRKAGMTPHWRECEAPLRRTQRDGADETILCRSQAPGM